MKYEVFGLEGAKSWKIEHNLSLWEAREVAREAQGCGYEQIVILNSNEEAVEKYHG